MPQRDIIVPNVKIKDKSIFSLDELYKTFYRWFEFHNYDFQEQEYREEDLAGKKHIEIKWYAEKRIDDYIKYVLEINFLIIGLEEVEIEQAGIKASSNKGEIELRVKAYILKDWNEKWEGQAFTKFLRGFYDRYLIKNRILGYESELYEETYNFMDEVKAFLNLHRF